MPRLAAFHLAKARLRITRKAILGAGAQARKPLACIAVVRNSLALNSANLANLDLNRLAEAGSRSSWGMRLIGGMGLVRLEAASGKTEHCLGLEIFLETFDAIFPAAA